MLNAIEIENNSTDPQFLKAYKWYRHFKWDPSWIRYALCWGQQGQWQEVSRNKDGFEEKRAVCMACPVRKECLSTAWEHKISQPCELAGIWGGYLWNEFAGRDPIAEKPWEIEYLQTKNVLVRDANNRPGDV